MQKEGRQHTAAGLLSWGRHVQIRFDARPGGSEAVTVAASELEPQKEAGMRPAVDLLRMEGEVGTVEPGKLADLVALDWDPLGGYLAATENADGDQERRVDLTL
jgi:hypothetical protein